ncbi:MAG: hypothetical protein WCX73_04550 [Candidatus Pacearchaeota archaeon]|jgi:translation elongation factor aEF-1 beta
MGTALVTIKIMPESPKSNLEEIQAKAKEIVEKNKGKNPSTKTESVAFGLNAVILNFALDESLSIDDIENPLRAIPSVVSAEVIDFRRAFG